MTLREAVLGHFMDEDGLVSLDPDPKKWSTGNGLLYTGLFVTCLALTGELDDFDAARFQKAVLSCQVVPGVYNRNHGRIDWTAHDDYVGVAAGSYFTGGKRAREIVEHGLTHDWCYNNIDPSVPTLRAWHGRFPGRRGFYYAAARENPGLLMRMGVNSGIRSAVDTLDHGSKLLTWLQVKVLERQSVCSQACEIFNDHIRSVYGTIGGLLMHAWDVKAHPLFEVGIV